MHIKLTGQEDLKDILDLVKDYESYYVEFARRYYELYFAKEKITEKDQVYANNQQDIFVTDDDRYIS